MENNPNSGLPESLKNWLGKGLILQGKICRDVSIYFILTKLIMSRDPRFLVFKKGLMIIFSD